MGYQGNRRIGRRISEKQEIRKRETRVSGNREAGPAEFGGTAAGVGIDFASVRHNYLGRRRLEQAVAKPACERLFDQAVFAAVETDDSDSPARPQTEWGHPQQLFERAKLIIDQDTHRLKCSCGRVKQSRP